MTRRPHTPPAQLPRRRRILVLTRKREAARVSRLLRGEAVGGVIVMIAALLGLVIANSPLSEAYLSLRETRIGVPLFTLSIGSWASDGLLAVFFFVIGLELKQEFVTGELSRARTAVVPVLGAFGGVAVPAAIYAALTFGSPAVRGWAIPTATDIAFAVAVLGLIAPRIPPALRVFLLTLAVVDDLIAIAIIAIFYSHGFHPLLLCAAVVPITLFAVLVRRFPAWFVRNRWAPWTILLPLGVITWALFHEGGVHATIAGVVLALLVPVRTREDGRRVFPAETLARRISPVSSGFAVPLFAFFASGVAFGGEHRFPMDPIAIGIIAGLVLGKPLGITLTTWLLTRFTKAELDSSVRWRQFLGVASLAGVGFTVSMLVSELSFTDRADTDTAHLAVMAASAIAVGVAALFLVRPIRPRMKRRSG